MNNRFIRTIAFSFLLLSLAGHAQSFEGKITYAIRIQSKLPNVTSEQFTQMLGNRQEYFIKGSHYKTIANGAVMQWQLYVPGENRLYSKMRTNGVVYWNDAAGNKDSVLDVQIIRRADTVLGYPCDKLILNCLGGTQEYEFNAKIAPAEASRFARHKLGNWYEMVKRTGALPLQYTLDNPKFTLTATAVLLTPESLDDTIFALPAGEKTQQAESE